MYKTVLFDLDAVANKIAVLRSFILRPAVGGADAVRGVGQVVNRVQPRKLPQPGAAGRDAGRV